MENIRNIKVTAHYDVDTTPSKFDALFAQYEAAKAIADETEHTKQPLINAMGDEKLKLIYRQLDVIVKRLNIISRCNGGAQMADASWYGGARKLTVRITTSHKWEKPTIYLCGYESPQEWWFDKDGIVTLWNKTDIYEQLENACERKLEKMIEAENYKTKNISSNYENMINY